MHPVSVTSSDLNVTGVIRVVVADDHPLVRGALIDLIDSQPNMTVVGSAADALEAAEIAISRRPDVVVLDVNMPHGGGWEAARRIGTELPQARLIAYSAHDEALVVRTMKTCGLSAYVSKGGDMAVLLAAIRGEPVPDVTAASSEPLRQRTTSVAASRAAAAAA